MVGEAADVVGRSALELKTEKVLRIGVITGPLNKSQLEVKRGQGGVVLGLSELIDIDFDVQIPLPGMSQEGRLGGVEGVARVDGECDLGEALSIGVPSSGQIPTGRGGYPMFVP